MERYAGSTPAYRIPTEREMKNFVIAVMLLIALSLYFSCCGNTPLETALQNGFGTQYKGDSGLIIPGDGDSLANTIIEPENAPEPSVADKKKATDEETPVTEVTEVTVSETEIVQTKITTKEKNNMDGILLSYWHGVATVLIGETVALMVAIAWMKIKGCK